jgi:hypothetical protein
MVSIVNILLLLLGTNKETIVRFIHMDVNDPAHRIPTLP